MNKKLREIMQLGRRARDRGREHAFIAEGTRLFSEIPADRIRQVLVSDSFRKENGLALLKGFPFEVVDDITFSQISDTKSPQGILAVADQMDACREDLVPADRAPLVLVLENIQDPGNLGTMIRAGEAAGITGIMASRDTVDQYNPKVVRSTMGSLFRVPFVTEECLTDGIRWLKERGVKVYAAALGAEWEYDLPDYRQGSAFLIGNEANGLTEECRNQANACIRIPMCGQVESLNAAVASAVLLFEASRQRRNL